MRTAWRTTLAACAALGTGASVWASPAAMTLTAARKAPPKAPAAEAPAVEATAAMPVNAVRPTATISPTKDPIKYFQAAIAELPFLPNSSASANPVMPPATQHNDALSLDRPVGPPTPQLFISFAQLSESQGNIAQARQQFGQALTMWPGNVEVLRAAARMEDRLGELALAETLYGQAVSANPQHAGALNDLGLCLARQGKLEASVQAIEQAVQLQPQKALYRNNAATVLVEMRQDQRALGHLVAVHGAAEANYNLGQLLVERGRASEATPFFQAAIEQNPQMQSAHVALAKLQGGATTSAAPQQAGVATPAAGYSPQAPAGPQFYYPATARSPEPGTSTYLPPAYQPAGAPGPGAARYLPPVASQPGALQR